MPVPDPILDGDTFFKGVNARLDPGQLEPGFVSSAINKRFNNGVVETRPGIKKMPWSNCLTEAYDDTKQYQNGEYVLYSGRKIDSGTISNINLTTEDTTGTVNLTSTVGPASNSKGPYFRAGSCTISGVISEHTTQASCEAAEPVNGTWLNVPNPPGANPLYGAEGVANTIQAGWADVGHRIFGFKKLDTDKVYGSGVFRDPSGTEYLLVAATSGVYATREGLQPVKLALPTNEDILEDVFFVQCFNVVVMMRGENQEPLVMKAIGTGFEKIAQEDTDTEIDENDDDGTEQIPNSDSDLFFGNRLLVPHQRDLVAVSDYLNYTRYQPVMANFRVNQGSEDELVALQKVDNTTIAAFKTNSIYVVSNLYGNTTDAFLDEVTRDYGAVSAKSTIAVGSDVWFLSSKKGICSLTVASHGKVNAVQLPVSELIQPVIDRINWNHADKAVAATYGNRYYCAVPLDSATENNAILVYDLLQQAWSGYDQGSAIAVKNFIEMEFQGKRRLFFLSTDGYINLYDDPLTFCGFVDEVAGSEGAISLEQISDEVTTRGYTANDISQKKWRSAEIQVATNDPKFTVTTVYDGPEENGENLVTDKTFSRVKYDKPFDKADFVQSNANNDFSTKYREDYSVKLAGETGGVDLNTNWTGVSEPIDTGFDPDLHQSSTNKYKFRGTGRYIQLKVANTQGRLELNTVKVGALAGENLIRKEL